MVWEIGGVVVRMSGSLGRAVGRILEMGAVMDIDEVSSRVDVSALVQRPASSLFWEARCLVNPPELSGCLHSGPEFDDSKTRV